VNSSLNYRSLQFVRSASPFQRRPARCDASRRHRCRGGEGLAVTCRRLSRGLSGESGFAGTEAGCDSTAGHPMRRASDCAHRVSPRQQGAGTTPHSARRGKASGASRTGTLSSRWRSCATRLPGPPIASHRALLPRAWCRSPFCRTRRWARMNGSSGRVERRGQWSATARSSSVLITTRPRVQTALRISRAQASFGSLSASSSGDGESTFAA